jgi:hypothetical protein
MAASSLQDRRTWLIGGAVAAVLIVAAGWFLLINPELSSADSLHAQAQAQRTANSEMAAKVADLKAKSAHVSTYVEQLKAAYDALPSDSGLAAYTRQVRELGATSHVDVEAITVGQIAPALGATSVSTPPASDTSSTGSSDSSTSAASDPSSASSAGSSGSSTTTATSGSTSAAPGTVFAVNLTVTSGGSLARQTSFLERLRSAGPRYGLVTSVQFAPGTGPTNASLDGADTMTTQVTVFSQPQTDAQLAQLHKLLNGDIGS